MKALFSFRNVAAAAAIAAVSFAAPATHADDVAKAAPAKEVSKAKATPKVRPLSISVDLIGAAKITGTLTDTTSLEMQTSFGTASIPLSEVAGIRFASAESASTTVVMLNGDSITGATDVKLVTVETEWGMATINGPNISSLLFVPDLNWSSEAGLNGKRWTLENAKKSVASKSSSKPSESDSNSSSSRSSSSSSRTSRVSSPQPIYTGR